MVKHYNKKSNKKYHKKRHYRTKKRSKHNVLHMRYSKISIMMLSFIVFMTVYITNSSAILANRAYTGDKYVTNTRITDSSNIEILNNGVMEINEIYSLDYEWQLPDNTYVQGDSLDFSIPIEFQIVQNFKFNLYQDGNEVAQVNVLGNANDGYYINMLFTTDYIETHSNVHGTFNLGYILNEQYIQVDSDNTIILPDKEIVIHVPKPDESGSGGGLGEDAGNPNTNVKQGDALYANLPESPNVTSTVFQWEIGLGRNTLLGNANSFDEIKHIYIEDSPYDQRMVPFGDVSAGWAGSYAFEGGFFTTLPWVYGGVSQDSLGLRLDSSNSYYNGFKMDILPRVLEYETFANDNGSGFKEYMLRYCTTPIYDVFEDTEFQNEAIITIVYDDDTSTSWVLSDSQMYNVADGTITGSTAGVEFTKVDSITGQGLSSAMFDLYKENMYGEYFKVKSDITSDNNGLVMTDGLTTGNYYFVETRSPDGYTLTTDHLYFSIVTEDLNGNNQSIQYKDVGIFKNSQEIKPTSVSVTKVWDDANNQDGIRPNNIRVQLYGDNTKIGDPIVLSDSNNWKYTWSDLDLTSDGKDIIYSVKEVDSIYGYDVTVDNSNHNNITITNSHSPETINITGNKSWNDMNNQDGKRPSSIVVNLLADGVIIDEANVSSDTNWSYTFNDLPKYNNGNEIVYTIKESHVPDYSVTYEGFNMMNEYTPEKTSVSVTKAWDDANNQDGIRPNNVKVQLYGNKVSLGDPIVLSEANNWQYTWSDLDLKSNGETIKYTVKELGTVDGYNVTVDDSNIGNIIITNTHVPETVNINGNKSWDDNNNQDGIRPNDIIVNLLADGTKIDDITVSADTNWEYSFTNLPKYNDGNEIIYTVTENAISDYSVTYNGYDIINTHSPDMTSVTVTKSWDDSNNQDGIRPDVIYVQLYGDNLAVGDPIELSESNNWQHTWSNLDLRSDGTEINYTVNELDSIDGYETIIDDSNIGNIIITNSHVPETIDISGEKSWNDNNDQDGKRPDSVNINLLANGNKIDDITVSADTNWEYSFTNLPKYNDGIEIVYTITEDHVLDYSVEFNDYNLTNAHTPDLTSVTVTKAWDDSNDYDGIRPKEIKVQLYGNNIPLGDPISLNNDNNWQYTWSGLDLKANGNDIVYTVDELDDIDGYEAVIDDSNLGNIIITNSHNPNFDEDPVHTDNSDSSLGKGSTTTPSGGKSTGAIPNLGSVSTLVYILLGMGLIGSVILVHRFNSKS